MPLFALIDNATEQVLQRRNFAAKPPNPQAPTKNWRWVPVETVAGPTYDPLRERLTITEEVMATKLKRTPAAVTLPPDQRKANADKEYRRLLATIVPEDLQMRRLTGAVRLLERKGRRPLTAPEQAQLDQLVAVGDWQELMEAKLAALEAEIDADTDTDLASGWPEPPGGWPPEPEGV